MSEAPRKVKHPEVTIGSSTYLRIPIKTHVIMKEDHLINTIKKYVSHDIMPDDLLFVTEKIVAITQGRAIPLTDIKPRPLAVMLSRYVTKTPAGIGLGMPETMEMALRECGIPRILFAAAMSAVTKPFGKKGVFYTIAGYKASSIDGPTPNTIPPYNQYVVLGPDRPDAVASAISDALGDIKVAIVDINDLSGAILGVSHKSIDKDLVVKILKDNPLGQDHEQTPLGIIRKVSH
ncbi:MAG: coenzyme F420-0:L-glutamate ligase [Firmicutes bacterium]|nr:coenzyme F420-0:L-glutamate ligase [Bacillota bacterium]